jgi:hypothetical protein
MTLTEFLAARLDEDEADARDDDGSPTPIGMWDPDRVLAEVAAKRAIVLEHEMMPARQSTLGVLRLADGREVSPYYVDGCCARCTAWGEYGGPANSETGGLDYCPTLRHLAAVYADHPDYDEAWRP